MPPEIDPKTPDPKTPDPKTPDPASELAALKAANAALEARLAKLEKPPVDDPDLKDKARLAREEADKKTGDTKALENALRFSMGSKDFLKNNESLLPKEVSDIFAQAEKEKYDSAIEKDAAIKSGLVQEFFKVQANVELLTPGLKASLDDFLKLTKTGKQEKAQHIYENVFEPAFEMLKRLKKAEALGKGYGGTSDLETSYKNRMIELSKKHYLGEKNVT